MGTFFIQMSNCRVWLTLAILQVLTNNFIHANHLWFKSIDPKTDSVRHFKPITDMTVIGACEWEIQATRLENRIPFQISEVMCRSRSASCGGNPFYRCRQLTSRMDVAYTNSSTSAVLYRRNIEVGIGCACVQTQTKRIEHFKQMLIEKKNLRK